MLTMHRGSMWKISVYGRDHGALHVHIERAWYRCSVDIETLEVIAGAPPRGVLRSEVG